MGDATKYERPAKYLFSGRFDYNQLYVPDIVPDVQVGLYSYEFYIDKCMQGATDTPRVP